MNDVLGRKIVAAGDPRFAGRASAELAAFLQESGAGRVVNRSIYPAAAEQRRIRGVHDCIDVERRDVGTDDLNTGRRIGHAYLKSFAMLR
jgi:hypothetical protein